MNKQIITLCFILTTISYSQFDSLIFSRHFARYQVSMVLNSVLGLGDQNDDGYDDILVYECNRQVAGIYFGGSPMDTIPEFEIYFPEDITAFLGFLLLDINGDNYEDIIVDYVANSRTYAKGFYGGSILDTIPDLILTPPEGASNYFAYGLHSLKNFDGSNHSTLVTRDIFLPFSNEELGTLYFYKTYPELDTIPFAVITGDSATDRQVYIRDSPGDINGDGFTDFTVGGYEGGYPYYRLAVYLGNPEWNIAPAVVYKQEEHIFDLSRMWIIEDINKDGKDDILSKDYNGTYPYYYDLAIWHGSFPIDTIPDVGINTMNLGFVYTELICSPGDVNGDTFNDLILGIGGGSPITGLWLGSRVMQNDVTKSWSSSALSLLAKVGDIDGDGVNDVCVGNAHSSCEGTYYDPDLIYIFKGDTSIKIDTGTVDITEDFTQPENYVLLDVYPNPFNPQTNIEFRTSELGLVNIKIYDTLGRLIAALVNEEKPAGKYSVIFNAEDYSLSSGVYIVRLEISGNGGREQQIQKKVQLIK
ncbi:MAG: T9SS type A sorting domain-containing protein [Ignavibacteriales bacterium]|nr:T9SS type A sorting domain-containing protein [Ignavibacteriales bacterium]